jgi:hypothetical protein
VIVQVLPGVAMLPPVRLILVELAVAVTVPLHELLTPGVEATCKPLVSVSLKAIPVSATELAAGFVMVKVTVVAPFNGMVVAPKALLIVGGVTTVKVAVLLVVPVPPSVEVMAPVVLLPSPATVPVTFTLKVQVALWATLPPDRLITPLPAVAVTVPLQVLLTLGVLATTTVAIPGPLLTGSVSLKATPLRSPAAVVLVLVMVKVRVLFAFSGMLVGLKPLLMVGGATTVREVLEVLPVPATVSLTVTLLGANPATVPLTFTEIVHDAPAAKLAPVKETTPEPATAVGVVLQVLVKPLGVATTRVPGAALGKVSVNEIPFSTDAALLLGLVIVNVRLVVPFSGIVEAPNTLLIVGGLITVRLGLAEAVLPLPASVESMVTLLGLIPSVVPVTLTVIVHGLPLTGKAAFKKLMLFAPALAVTLPPQPLTTLGVAATTKPVTVPPEVRSSVKLELMVTTLGFVIENVMVLVPLTLITVGLKLFVMEGGCKTMILAVTVA